MSVDISIISFIVSLILLCMVIEGYAKSKRLDREMKEMRLRVDYLEKSKN